MSSLKQKRWYWYFSSRPNAYKQTDESEPLDTFEEKGSYMFCSKVFKLDQELRINLIQGVHDLVDGIIELKGTK